LNPTQETTQVIFFNTKINTIKPTLHIPLKIYNEVKSKTCTTVQSYETNSNQNFNDLKQNRRIIYLLVIFFSSVESVYFDQFFAFSAPNLFVTLDHTKPYVEKIHSIDAELQDMRINLT